MLGDPGINLVASRDFPWHGSKKADGEASTSWISERVDRERAAAEAFKKFSPPHTDAHISISNLDMHVFVLYLGHYAKSHAL
jgi:hypothetical protein